MTTLTPKTKLIIAGKLLSLNDNDLILVNEILNNIKTSKVKKELYRAVNDLEHKKSPKKIFLKLKRERGDNNTILINTTNPLKKKIINRALKISDDKVEEVINILELLNFSEITNKDISLIKYYILGLAEGKQK